MQAALKAAGFEVIETFDADKRKLDAALRAFADVLARAGGQVEEGAQAGAGLIPLCDGDGDGIVEQRFALGQDRRHQRVLVRRPLLLSRQGLLGLPSQRHRMVEFLADLLAPAIEESLRFNTSAQRFKRTATRDVELHGETIRKGDKGAMTLGALDFDKALAVFKELTGAK